MHYPKISYWQETAGQIKNTNTKDKTDIKNKKFDILIIGGGITGLTAAYMLKDCGYKIGIIEGSTIGCGTSGYTTAKITVQHDLRYDYLINSFGLDKAKQYLSANEEGFKIIKEIIHTNNIDCDFKEQTAYVYTTKEEEIEELKNELKAYKELSIDGFFTEDVNLPIKVLGAIGVRNQGQFNPLKYLYSLYNILADSSMEIYENVRAINIEPHSKRVFDSCGVKKSLKSLKRLYFFVKF